MPKWRNFCKSSHTFALKKSSFYGIRAFCRFSKYWLIPATFCVYFRSLNDSMTTMVSNKLYIPKTQTLYVVMSQAKKVDSRWFFLMMTGFELRTSGGRSNNWATNTSQLDCTVSHSVQRNHSKCFRLKSDCPFGSSGTLPTLIDR